MAVIRSVKEDIVSLFTEKGIQSAGYEADLLLGFVLSLDRIFIHSHPEYPVSEYEAESIRRLSFERAEKRVPIQYLLGDQEFYGYRIQVGPGCLIPRPETELLVDKALEEFSSGRFLDWGTGSGAIAVALLNEIPDSRGIAVECSPRAISWAWRNIEQHDLFDRCLLLHNCDIHKIPVAKASLDLIISNPPYIKTDAIPALMPEVSAHEPAMSLDGGPWGTSCYPGLLSFAACRLCEGGRLLVEIGGEHQVEELRDISPPALDLETIIQDYSGISRIMMWRRL